MDHHGNVRLDVARGLSALVVFVAHVSQVYVWPYLPPMSVVEIIAGTAAREAVLVFFLLSGFLITTSITKNIARNGYFDPMDYLIGRIARIFPPFLFAIAITLLVYFVIRHFGLPGGTGPLGDLRPGGLASAPAEIWHAIVLHDGLTSINGPLWTLYIEAKLYVVAMGIAMTVSAKSLPLKIIGAGVTILAIKIAYDTHGNMLLFLSAIWIMGAFARFDFAQHISRFAVISLAVTLFCASLSPIYASSYLDGSKTALAMQALSCAMFAYIIMIRRWTEKSYPAWMRRSAEYSYTLYVIHFPFLALGLSIAISLGVNDLVVSLLLALIFGSVALIAAMIASVPLENDMWFKRIMKITIFRSIGVN